MLRGKNRQRGEDKRCFGGRNVVEGEGSGSWTSRQEQVLLNASISSMEVKRRGHGKHEAI